LPGQRDRTRPALTATRDCLTMADCKKHSAAIRI
jgi:hypothetical protein